MRERRFHSKTRPKRTPAASKTYIFTPNLDVTKTETLPVDSLSLCQSQCWDPCQRLPGPGGTGTRIPKMPPLRMGQEWGKREE